MAIQLSIISVTYNDHPGLLKTLASLKTLAVSALKWESVVVDSSLGEINLSEFHNISYFKTPAKGIYNAMNVGLEKARGNYVWFLNGGDELASASQLISAIEYMKAKPSVEMLMAGVTLTEGGKMLYSQIPRRMLLKNILGANFLCHQGLIYKKSVFSKVGFFNENLKLASDYEHHWNCYFNNINCEHFEQVIGVFDTSGGSSQYKKVFAEFYEVHKRINSHMTLVLRLVNKFFYYFYFLRIIILKLIKATPVGAKLRPLWLKYKRGL